jgi:hypothetical protein
LTFDVTNFDAHFAENLRIPLKVIPPPPSIKTNGRDTNRKIVHQRRLQPSWPDSIFIGLEPIKCLQAFANAMVEVMPTIAIWLRMSTLGLYQWFIKL